MPSLAKRLEIELTKEFGHVLAADPLYKLLGFPNIKSLNQGVSRGQIPVPIFSIEYRRGKFALTRDVAAWLAKKRSSAVKELHKEAI